MFDAALPEIGAGFRLGAPSFGETDARLSTRAAPLCETLLVMNVKPPRSAQSTALEPSASALVVGASSGELDVRASLR
jgi:hypothetical protein